MWLCGDTQIISALSCLLDADVARSCRNLCDLIVADVKKTVREISSHHLKALLSHKTMRHTKLFIAFSFIFMKYSKEMTTKYTVPAKGMSCFWYSREELLEVGVKGKGDGGESQYYPAAESRAAPTEQPWGDGGTTMISTNWTRSDVWTLLMRWS